MIFIGSKMKLVKEHIILEKFTEDSDPIRDMGIGLPIARLKIGSIIKVKKYGLNANHSYYLGSRKFKIVVSKSETSYSDIPPSYFGFIMKKIIKGKNMYLEIPFYGEQGKPSKLLLKHRDDFLKTKHNYHNLSYGCATLSIKRWNEYLEIIE